MRIVLGIEADFIPDTLEETAAALRQYPFEYVIGSVHIVGDRFGFDHPEMAGRLEAYGIDRIHLESLELTRQAAESGLFDVVGHLDHAKKFGPPRDARGGGGRRERGAARRGGGRHARRGQHRRPAQAGRRDVPGARRSSPRRTRSASRSCSAPTRTGPSTSGYAFDRAAELARAAGYEALSRPYADALEPLS